MENLVCIWKPVGLSPLEVVKLYKNKYPKYKKETISYAGRLDPMTEGVLLLLIGEENKKRDRYLKLNKEYISEIILGISTDTFDSLGLITKINKKEVNKIEIENILRSFKGKQTQKYPPFSSKTVNGKPLYWWARNEKIDEINIPEHEIEIYSIKLIDFEKITNNLLVDNIINKLKVVNGDFRQKEIIRKWEELKKNNSKVELVKIKIRITCSSGTYVRRIASDLGAKLNTEAFAYSILRTKVGNLKKEDCLVLD